MQAIGLVPWVRRTANAQAVQVEAAPLNAAQSVMVSGETDSSLLLIFDVRDGDVRDAGAWPLSKADDALLDGMLRAIGMSKATACSCAILPDASVQGSSVLQALCQTPRKRFLYFGGEAIAADVIDPIPMTQGSVGSEIDGWRLPSLAMLRETPQRKRQAWVTLKKLRSALDHN